MCRPQSAGVLLTLILLNSHQRSIAEEITYEEAKHLPVSHKEHKDACNFEDPVCMTHAAKMEKLVLDKYIDPIVVPRFALNISNIQYEMTKTKLTGLKDKCHVELLVFNNTMMTFDYILECSELVLTSHFSGKGSISSISFSRSGTLTITTGTYKIESTGKFDLRTNEYADPPYDFIFLKYSTIKTVTKAINAVKFKFDDPSSSNNLLTQPNILETYLNKNWSNMEKILMEPVMNPLILIVMQAAETYSQATPVEDIAPRYFEDTECEK